MIILEEAYNNLEKTTVPELQRSSMAPVVLQLKALAIDNVLRFHYMSVSKRVGLVGGVLINVFFLSHPQPNHCYRVWNCYMLLEVNLIYLIN